MQRLPYHVRDMLSTRNPSDRWIKAMKTAIPPIPENFHIHSTTGRLVSLDVETLGEILDLAMEGLENCAKGSNGMLTKTEECAMGVINTLKLYYPQLKD